MMPNMPMPPGAMPDWMQGNAAPKPDWVKKTKSKAKPVAKKKKKPAIKPKK